MLVFLATVASSGCLILLHSALSVPLWRKMGISLVVGGLVYVLLIFLFSILRIDELRSLRSKS